MDSLSTRHLIGIKNINENDIHLILETAKEFKEVINRPIKKVPSLRDITIANLFFENSTRTRLSLNLLKKDYQPIPLILLLQEVLSKKGKLC